MKRPVSVLAGRETSLYRLADLAAELAAERVALTTRLIADRISEGRFYVACMGQFKRGKSTLLNALLGQAILPAGVIPVTSVPTILRYGTVLELRVRLRGSDWKSIPVSEIEEYVSEARNPENVKGVDALEICVPCTLLETGMCLVDTPGIGSVFGGNSRATNEFVPQMDAALFVIGVDPPISGDELNLAEKVAREIPEILFVLNKADRASNEDCSTATKFARRVLETRLGRSVPEIFEVSALERLEGHGPERDWPKLLQALEQRANQSGRALVWTAAERAARRAAAHILAAIEEDRCAMQRPLEESESRIGELRRMHEKATQTMQDLGALFTVEQQRFSRLLADRRRLFLDRTRDGARDELREHFSFAPHRRDGPAYRRKLMHLAQEIARGKLIPWFTSEERYAEQTFHKTMQRFIELAQDFLHRLTEMGPLPGADYLPEIDSEASLQSKSQFHFYVIERIAAPASPLLFIADVVRGLLGIRGGIQHEALEFLDYLLEVNSARVQRDVDDRIRESRRRLEIEIKTILREVLDMAEHALARARTAHASGAATVQALLGRLDEVECEIENILHSYEGMEKKSLDLPEPGSN